MSSSVPQHDHLLPVAVSAQQQESALPFPAQENDDMPSNSSDSPSRGKNKRRRTSAMDAVAEDNATSEGGAAKDASSVNSGSNNAEEGSNEKSSSDDAFKQPDGWRVKLYRLNQDGTWDDCGTGRIVCLYRPPAHALTAAASMDAWLHQETGEATLCVHAEVTKAHRQPRVLLRTRILLREPYQQQGENIVTWCEPGYGRESAVGVDLALSFQDNAGCLDIWNQITKVQARAAELLQQHTPTPAPQPQQAPQQDQQSEPPTPHQPLTWQMLPEQEEEVATFESATLPHPPSLANLDEIADTIALHFQQHGREALAHSIAAKESAYLKELLQLFPEAEEACDYGKLATLAACVKTVLLLNDPTVLELIVHASPMFEQVCACLEYDPDLREKANHRWFLCERAKFRTVVPMEPMLEQAIHRSFRVQYLRDTLLRPTMDESTLSTLSSLQTFTHADVVKGVTMAAAHAPSYLVRVLKLLGQEVHAVSWMEWHTPVNSINVSSSSATNNGQSIIEQPDLQKFDPVLMSQGQSTKGPWKQHVAPQDGSLPSRKTRRRGCLSFLRELFSMVRLSLQQTDKDDFFAVICTMALDADDDAVSQTSSQAVEVGSVTSKSDQNDTQPTEIPPAGPVHLLSLLAHVLADPTADVSEKSTILEIVSGVAVHDAHLIRRHCLELEKREMGTIRPPDAAYDRKVLFVPPPHDLLASLIFLLDVETDAGLLLQVSEILRMILDTDMMADHAGSLFADEPSVNSAGDNGSAAPEAGGSPTGRAPNGQSTNDPKPFLSLFYEHHVEWLVAPFSSTLQHPARCVPMIIWKQATGKHQQQEDAVWNQMMQAFQAGDSSSPLVATVPVSALRASFAVELLSFCVRAHIHRMKFFLLKSRGVLANVLKVLRPQPLVVSGDRCLKLSALRFLRAILSVGDEFYHRHIIQHNLFEPVFEALRTNPVGDNLVSSAIVEMCDYIHNGNITSLMDHIVTKHLKENEASTDVPSLEDVSSPYVNTLTLLRTTYEAQKSHTANQSPTGTAADGFLGGPRPLSGKALEDQRKFQQADQEESYFDGDDDVEQRPGASQEVSNNAVPHHPHHRHHHHPSSPPSVAASPPPSPPPGKSLMPPAVDEVAAVVDSQNNAAAVAAAADLHRTPRMFSLSQLHNQHHHHHQHRNLEQPHATPQHQEGQQPPS